LTRLLYRLLQAYFSCSPKPAWERVYRQLLVMGVRSYRVLIRPFISNECQFSVTCSQFTLDLIAGYEPFDQVRQRCLQRYCECSRPFDRILVGDRQLFISCVGREVDAQEVSPHHRRAALITGITQKF
jgi:putative component of membrane protein insertase Oxa1/YidC/SpoIIIJ protein YidD